MAKNNNNNIKQMKYWLKKSPHQKLTKQKTNKQTNNNKKTVKFCLCQTFIWILVYETQCQSLYIRIVKLYWKSGEFIDKIRLGSVSLELKLSSDEKTGKFFFDESFLTGTTKYQHYFGHRSIKISFKIGPKTGVNSLLGEKSWE